MNNFDFEFQVVFVTLHIVNFVNDVLDQTSLFNYAFIIALYMN